MISISKQTIEFSVPQLQLLQIAENGGKVVSLGIPKATFPLTADSSKNGGEIPLSE
jgi:hypothetical protein